MGLDPTLKENKHPYTTRQPTGLIVRKPTSLRNLAPAVERSCKKGGQLGLQTASAHRIDDERWKQRIQCQRDSFLGGPGHWLLPPDYIVVGIRASQIGDTSLV